ITRGQATRGEILEALPIRPATLSCLLQTLIHRGVLEEPERKGKRTGRRASPVRIRRDQGFFVGIHLDFPCTVGACIDAGGEVVAVAKRDSPMLKTRRDAQREIEDVIAELRRNLGARWKKVQGIGFADPGVVDTQTGVSIRAVNLEGWKGLPTRHWLEKITGVAAIIYPDAAARAYAEATAFRPAFPTSLLHLQLDAGIGGGFVREGELMLGATQCAMEIGHLIIREGGPLCQCGNRGCLEAFCSLGALRQHVEELNEQGVRTVLNAANFTFQQLAKSHREGDKAARMLVQEIGFHVGSAMAMAVTILNPQVIVLAGGLTLVGEPLVTSAHHVLTQRCLPDALKNLVVKLSELPAHGTALGAALLVRRRFLVEKRVPLKTSLETHRPTNTS
ncbi:MAG: ROK family protein, partial [Verrucomicrobiia bacterium]